MTATALYRALRYANVPEEVAEEAVEGLAFTHDVATKKDLADLRTELKTDIAQSEVRMVKWQVATNGAYAGLIIASMGWMIKFWVL